jgi:hypothetical protein
MHCAASACWVSPVSEDGSNMVCSGVLVVGFRSVRRRPWLNGDSCQNLVPTLCAGRHRYRGTSIAFPRRAKGFANMSLAFVFLVSYPLIPFVQPYTIYSPGRILPPHFPSLAPHRTHSLSNKSSEPTGPRARSSHVEIKPLTACGRAASRSILSHIPS